MMVRAGAILVGTLGTFIFLKAIDLSLGWRLAFLIGPVLGLLRSCWCGGTTKPALAGHERGEWRPPSARSPTGRGGVHRRHSAHGRRSKAIELQPTEKIDWR